MSPDALRSVTDSSEEDETTPIRPVVVVARDAPTTAAEEPFSLAERVARYEQSLIEDALRATGGNQARAARLLRTTERILGYRVQRYGIDCSRYRV